MTLPCPDCERCAKCANAEHTTPGFFYDKCEEHRQPAPPVEARAATLAFTLREQAQEMESPYYTKTPAEPDWDYVAKAFREIADDVELALQAAEREEAKLWREAIFTGTSSDLMAWIKQRWVELGLEGRALARETPAKEPMGTCSLISKPHPQSNCGKAWRPLENKS
jgi:hypothetical protein